MLTRCLTMLIAIQGTGLLTYGQDDIRRQADELAALATFQGAILGPVQRPLLSQKSRTEHQQIMQRLSAPELRPVTKDYADLIRKAEQMIEASREMNRDEPVPEKIFGKRIAQLAEDSRQGKFKSYEYRFDGWDRLGNPHQSLVEHDTTMPVSYTHLTLPTICSV